MAGNFKVLKLVGIASCLLFYALSAYAYYPPDPTITFHGDADGDEYIVPLDMPVHETQANVGLCLDYNTMQPKNDDDRWNTCDADGDTYCTVLDLPYLYTVSAGGIIDSSPFGSTWAVDFYNQQTSYPATQWNPFQLNVTADPSYFGYATGRPGMIVKVTIVPEGSTTTGKLSGRNCTPDYFGDPDQLNTGDDQCAVGVSVTHWMVDPTLGLTENAGEPDNDPMGLQIQADAPGTIHILAEVNAVDSFLIPAFSNNFYVHFEPVFVPAIWYVRMGATGQNNGTSWTDAFTVVQDAMDAASSGDMIWVVEGTYTRPIGWHEPVLAMKNGVEVYGGFIGTESSLSQRIDSTFPPTELDGQNASYHVVVGASNARLDGFTITRGNATGSEDKGGGMYNAGVSNLVVSKCIFIGNLAGAGGGMYNNDTSSPAIVNCIFIGNSANNYYGGGIYNWYSPQPTITNCTFSGNQAYVYGGAIFNFGSSPTITNCILWGDTAPTGPEIQNEGSSSPTITYSDVQGGYTGTGNINADPKFIGYPNMDIQSSSPCVNTGTSQGAPDDDIADNNRPLPAGGNYDMGAYENSGLSIQIDCSNPGPNPVNELSPMQCSIITIWTPRKNIVSDTCGGTVSTSAPWTYNFTPTEAQGPGTCRAAVELVEEPSRKDYKTININEVNIPPTNNAPPSSTGNELTLISFNTNPTDPDIPVQTLTSSVVSTTGACSSGSFVGNVWSWTPTEAQGPTSCNVVSRVYDGVGYSTNKTTHIKVNEVNVAPTDNAPPSVGGYPRTMISININPTDPDIPTQTLTCALVNNFCPGGIFNGCVWGWAPVDSEGPTSCNVVTKAYDGIVYSSEITTHVIVYPPNTLPMDNAPAISVGNELTPISFKINPTDADMPPQTLTCIMEANFCPAGNLNGCTWSGWTPTEAEGPTSCDVITKVFDGIDQGPNKITHVIVNEVNIAPTDNAPTSSSWNELTPIIFYIKPTDPDIPAQTLTCEMVSNGCPAGSVNNCIWSGWTPTEAEGPTSCNVVTRAYDGLVYSSNKTTHVKVLEVNIAPTDNAPTTITGNELALISFNTNPTDSDIPVQTLTSSVVSTTYACSSGSLVGHVWSWTPTEAQGPTSCNVVTRVYDGVAYSANRTTHIKVNEVNVAPTDNAPPSASGYPRTLISFNVNPTDPDFPTQTLTCLASNYCPGGILNGCVWDWTPLDSDGPTSCNVVTQVYDGVVYSSKVTTHIVVYSPNTPPTDNAPASTIGNELTQISFNINPSDNDIPAQTLTCSQVTNSCPGGSLNNCIWS